MASLRGSKLESTKAAPSYLSKSLMLSIAAPLTLLSSSSVMSMMSLGMIFILKCSYKAASNLS